MARLRTLARLATAVALGLSAGGCGDAPAPPERTAGPPPVPVRVAAVEASSLPVLVEAVGTVRARATTVIAANLAAYVAEVRVREGSRVVAGELLVRLDDADVRLQRARAEAAREAARQAREEARETLAEARVRVDEARAVLAEAEAGIEAARRGVEESEAAVHAAEAQATLARTALARYRQMYEERALSPHEYDEAMARERTARAELDRARARADGARSVLLQSRSRAAQARTAVEAARVRVAALESRGRLAEARIQEAEAEVARAEVQLAYARLTAPGASLVVQKSVETGDLAVPGRPLLTLEDPAGYRLEAQIPASHAQTVRLNDPVEVAIDDLAVPALRGRVVEIVPAADPATRTITAKIELPPAPGLRSGLYGRARLPVGQVERLTMPVAATVERGPLTLVYVPDAAGTARLRYVTLGARHGDRVEVLSGLAPDERVVVAGADRLGDGVRVTVGP